MSDTPGRSGGLGACISLGTQKAECQRVEFRVSTRVLHPATLEHSPLIQPHIVLHKEQVLIGQIRGPQGGGQVDVLEEHPS